MDFQVLLVFLSSGLYLLSRRRRGFVVRESNLVKVVLVELSDKAGEVTMLESTRLRKGAEHNTPDEKFLSCLGRFFCLVYIPW
jgi:hypothetical protein